VRRNLFVNEALPNWGSLAFLTTLSGSSKRADTVSHTGSDEADLSREAYVTPVNVDRHFFISAVIESAKRI
jgi:hypothetical protein